MKRKIDVSDLGQLTHELGDEVPPRLCSKMVALLIDLEEWVEEIHPQATWPKHHGNQEEK